MRSADWLREIEGEERKPEFRSWDGGFRYRTGGHLRSISASREDRQAWRIVASHHSPDRRDFREAWLLHRSRPIATSDAPAIRYCTMSVTVFIATNADKRNVQRWQPCGSPTRLRGATAPAPPPVPKPRAGFRFDIKHKAGNVFTTRSHPAHSDAVFATRRSRKSSGIFYKIA